MKGTRVGKRHEPAKKHLEMERGSRGAEGGPPFGSGVVLDEGGKEAWRTWEKRVGQRGKGASTCDALGDKEVCGR